MSMDLMDANGNGHNEARDTMFLLGGAALMLFGAGMILSNPAVRRYLGNAGIGNLVSAAVPDIEKYVKIRGM
jgi:hypothetical protein